MKGKNQYGTGAHQAYRPLGFTVDRTNLFVGRAEFHVFEAFNSPNSSYMSLTYGKTVSAQVGLDAMAGTKQLGRPICVGVERRYDEQLSMAIYTYTFEGIATDHSQRFEEFELQFSLEQAPIETHPNFQTLNDTFGPYDSLNRLWQPIVTSASASTGLRQSSQGGPVTNPMYGITSYLIPTCTYRISYAGTDDDVDTSFLDGVGSIQTPRGPRGPDVGFQKFIQLLTQKGTGRNWLKMAPKVSQRGACVTITEEWLLSGPIRFLDQIYSEDALRGQAI